MYEINQYEERPWGSYRVLDVGKNYCKKEIIVQPGKILSLQSHQYRKEHWEVITGSLVVMLNTQKILLETGNTIDIPVGALHCMANLSNDPCIVEELQTGICKEDDIIRYADNYGRSTIEECIHMYNQLKNKL
jgi:mannose-6-phosphate isomerase-like protein (cupin superfamily)